MTEYKSGMVSIIGKPNVGKSTLINAIMGQKMSIISSKPHTTRNEIHAIYHKDGSQIIFIDTPGINNAQDKVGTFLNKIAINAIKDVEFITVIFAADRRITPEDHKVINILQTMKTNAFVMAVISKIDIIDKGQLILKLNEVANLFNWNEIIPLSAKVNDNVDKYLTIIENNLSPGLQYYSSDQKTNITNNFAIKEIIREKCFYYLQQELPYAIAITLDKVINEEKKVIIYANIIVDKKSQKSIIIGSKGSMIKKISTDARIEIAKTLHKKIFLNLFVKINDNWKSSNNSIAEYLNPND